MTCLLSILLLFISWIANADINVTEIKVAASDVAPFSYSKEGKLQGYHIDIFKQLEKETNLQFKYDLFPHARLMQLLVNENPDLVILFRKTCENHSSSYEVQNVLYTLVPTIFLKSTIDPKKQTIRVGRLIGTCSTLIKKHTKNEMVFDVVSMDQAIEMIVTDRLDGVCGLGPVINYSIKKNRNYKEKLVIYKTERQASYNEAVICRKKKLPVNIKKKLEVAAKKIIIPDFN